MGIVANSEVPDEMPQHVAFHQGVQFVKTKVKTIVLLSVHMGHKCLTLSP